MQTALIVMVWGVWFSASPAWAVLGQPVASVRTDQQALQAQRRTSTHDSYRVEHLEAVDGTVVREYVLPSGLVFGLAWQGPTVPDMTQLLGAYFPAYQDALRAAGPRGQVRRQPFDPSGSREFYATWRRVLGNAKVKRLVNQLCYGGRRTP